MQHLDVLVSINAKDFPFQKFMVSERFPVILDELGLNPGNLSSKGKNPSLRKNSEKSPVSGFCRRVSVTTDSSHPWMGGFFAFCFLEIHTKS